MPGQTSRLGASPQTESAASIEYRYRRLRRAELPQTTVDLARFLIGAVLVRESIDGRASLRIVETEAYVPDDASSHAFRGLTQRNRAMFLRRGHAYVYFIYGTSYCLNVTSETPGVGAAVLVRAGEPLEGIELMERRRGCTRARDLARGPGRFAGALGIDATFDGADLCAAGALWLSTGPRPAGEIRESKRIGISRETERQLRFFERGNPFVSGPASLNR